MTVFMRGILCFCVIDYRAADKMDTILWYKPGGSINLLALPTNFGRKMKQASKGWLGSIEVRCPVSHRWVFIEFEGWTPSVRVVRR